MIYIRGKHYKYPYLIYANLFHQHVYKIFILLNLFESNIDEVFKKNYRFTLTKLPMTITTFKWNCFQAKLTTLITSLTYKNRRNKIILFHLLPVKSKLTSFRKIFWKIMSIVVPIEFLKKFITEPNKTIRHAKPLTKIKIHFFKNPG